MFSVACFFLFFVACYHFRNKNKTKTIILWEIDLGRSEARELGPACKILDGNIQLVDISDQTLHDSKEDSNFLCLLKVPHVNPRSQNILGDS